MTTPQGAADETQNFPLEMAYVLFMDIVGYSRMPTDVQQETLRRLQSSVRSGAEFRKAQEQQRLISLPTGDGMALAFFGDPESAVRCAVETTRALRRQEEIPLRMGLHAGPVYRVTDINANQNVAGDGINIAQRVMDCGDAGHILLSKAMADVLRQLSGWRDSLHDLGEASVKHGVKVHVFNLVTEGAGRVELPAKLQSAKDSEQNRKRRRLVLAACAAVLIVGGGVAVKFWMTPKIPRRPRVAVMDFKNLLATSGTGWVSTTLSEGLRIELGAGNQMVPTPGKEIADMMRDLSLSSEATYETSTLQAIKSNLGCDYIVSGSYTDPGQEAGGNMTVTLQMVNAESGAQVAKATESGTETGIAQLVMSLGGKLREQVRLVGISPEEIGHIQAAIPSGSAAQQSYYDAVKRQRAFDLLGARDSYLKAIEADRYFPLAHAGLAEVWRGLGYDGKAAEEAKMALDLSVQLGKDDKKLVEALYRTTTYDWDGAAKIYGALWTVNEDVPEYALLAVDAEIRGKKANESLGMLGELRLKPGILANSPLIDLKEAEAYESLGDSTKEAEAATKASEKARAMRRRLLQSEALWRLCGAKASLGDQNGATRACNESMDIAKAIKDQLRIARNLTVLGLILESQGDFSGGLAKYVQALEIAKTLGAQRDVIGAKINISDVKGSMGDHQGALDGYNDALKLARETQDQQHIADLTNNLGVEYQAGGEYAEALKSYKESLEAARMIHDQGSEARALGNAAGIDALQGRLSAAATGAGEAMKLARQLGLNRDAIAYLYQLGDVQLAQGDAAGAEKSYRDGIATSNSQQDKTNEALGWLSLSLVKLQLPVATEDSAEAASLAQKASEEFHSEGLKAQESSALAALALAKLGQGNPGEASALIQQAQDLHPADPAIKLPVSIALARVQVRAGQADRAKSTLMNVIQEAKRLNLLGIRMEAELALGELKNQTGNSRESISLLSSLEKESGQQGFQGIQQRAQKLLQSMNGK